MLKERPKGIVITPAGTFKVPIRLPDGKTRAPTFKTLGEAQAFHEAAHDAIEHGDMVPDPRRIERGRKRKYVKFGSMAELWLDRQYGNDVCTPETVEAVRSKLRNWILPVLGDRRVGEIQPEDIQELRRTVTAKRSANMGSRVTRIVWGVLQMAWEEGLIDANPAFRASQTRTKATGRTKRRHLQLAEVYSITTLVHARYRIGIWIQRLCGLRVGELFGIRLQDIDHDRRVLRVREGGGSTGPSADAEGMTGRLKTETSSRWVGIPDALYDLLVDYVEQFHTESPPDARLMVSARGGVGYGSYRRSVREACARLGFLRADDEVETCHALRGSMITELYTRGANPRWISAVAGHTIQDPAAGAAITFSVYLLETEDLTPQLSLAEELDRAIAEQLPLGLSVNDCMPGWLTTVEASVVLGTSPSHVSTLARRGDIVSVRASRDGAPPRRLLLETSVQATRDQRRDYVSLADCQAVLSLSASTVLRYVAALGHEVTRGRNGASQAWMPREIFDELASVIDAEEEFAAAHVSLADAAHQLGVGRAMIDTLSRSGVLVEVQPPRPPWVSGPSMKRWFTPKSVARALHTKVRWHRATTRTGPGPGLLTRTEAALALGVTVDTLVAWTRAGHLKAVIDHPEGRRRRVYFTIDDVEAARAVRRPTLRRRR